MFVGWGVGEEGSLLGQEQGTKEAKQGEEDVPDDRGGPAGGLKPKWDKKIAQ
jgi:hypothetical protein